MTAADAGKAPRCPANCSVFQYRLAKVTATGWLIATVSPEQRAQQHAVQADKAE